MSLRPAREVKSNGKCVFSGNVPLLRFNLKLSLSYHFILSSKLGLSCGARSAMSMLVAWKLHHRIQVFARVAWKVDTRLTVSFMWPLTGKEAKRAVAMSVKNNAKADSKHGVFRSIRKGDAQPGKVRGTGRWKTWTAETMITTSFLCNNIVFLIFLGMLLEFDLLV